MLSFLGTRPAKEGDAQCALPASMPGRRGQVKRVGPTALVRGSLRLPANKLSSAQFGKSEPRGWPGANESGESAQGKPVDDPSDHSSASQTAPIVPLRGRAAGCSGRLGRFRRGPAASPAPIPPAPVGADVSVGWVDPGSRSRNWCSAPTWPLPPSAVSAIPLIRSSDWVLRRVVFVMGGVRSECSLMCGGPLTCCVILRGSAPSHFAAWNGTGGRTARNRECLDQYR